MQKGFTLIELLVVVLIIGILSSVALPQYQKAVMKSRMAEAWANLKTINMAATAYCLENPSGGLGYLSDEVLDVNIETQTKNFTYELYAECDAPADTRIRAHARYNEDYYGIDLYIHPTTGRRSCVGSSCSKIGFAKEGDSSICTFVSGGTNGGCGTAETCYYAD